MSEGWKQVLADIRNALRGNVPAARSESVATPAAPTTSTPSAPEPTPAAIQAEDASEWLGAAEIATPVVEPDRVPITEPAHVVQEATPEVVLTDTATPAKTKWGVMDWGVGLLVLVMLGVTVWQLGLGAWWSRWTAPRPPASDVVATFDGGAITTADMEAHLRLLAPQAYSDSVKSLDTLRSLVQEMLADEAARRWAASQKVNADQNFQHSMEHITEDINLDSFGSNLRAGQINITESEIQAYYEKNKAQLGGQSLTDSREQIRQRLVSERGSAYLRDYIDRLKSAASITRDDALLQAPSPTENDLRTYYDANRRTFTTTARFVVDVLLVPIGNASRDETDARANADKALVKLRSGAAFADVAREITQTRLFTNTPVAADTQDPAWDAALSKLRPGELSEVFRADNAFQIVRLIKSEPSRLQTFEEARMDITARLTQTELDDWMRANGGKTLFTIKGKRYTLEQFYREYQELGPETRVSFSGADGLKRLADALIDRLVLVEDTYDQLLQVKNKDLIDQTRLDIVKQMMDQQEVDDKISVSAEEIKQYYEQNQTQMQLPAQARIRYIRVGLGNSADEQNAAKARADEAYKKLVPGLLQQGEDFASVAKSYSEDPETAAKGGELPGWLGETNEPFEQPNLHALHDLVLALPLNQVSPPMPVGDSLYIIQPFERTEPQMLALDAAEPYIKKMLQTQKHNQLQRDLIDKLTQPLNLVIYDSVLEGYVQQQTR